MAIFKEIQIYTFFLFFSLIFAKEYLQNRSHGIHSIYKDFVFLNEQQPKKRKTDFYRP